MLKSLMRFWPVGAFVIVGSIPVASGEPWESIEPPKRQGRGGKPAGAKPSGNRARRRRRGGNRGARKAA